MFSPHLILFIIGCLCIYFSFTLPDSMKFSTEERNVEQPKATKTKLRQVKKGEVKREDKVLVEEEWIDCIVTRNVDADTIWVMYKGEEYKVRLFAVDALESYCYGKSQPYGKEAKQYLESMVKVGDKVNLIPKGSGNHKRIAAIVKKGNKNINEEMVKSGLAFVDRHYSRRDKEWEKVLLNIQEVARKNRAGAWKQRQVVMPWDFRKQLREEFKLRKVA